MDPLWAPRRDDQSTGIVYTAREAGPAFIVVPPAALATPEGSIHESLFGGRSRPQHHLGEHVDEHPEPHVELQSGEDLLLYLGVSDDGRRKNVRELDGIGSRTQHLAELGIAILDGGAQAHNATLEPAELTRGPLQGRFARRRQQLGTKAGIGALERYLLQETYTLQAGDENVVPAVRQALGVHDVRGAADLVYGRVLAARRAVLVDEHDADRRIQLEHIGDERELDGVGHLHGENGPRKENRPRESQHRQSPQRSRAQVLDVHSLGLNKGRVVGASGSWRNAAFFPYDNVRASVTAMSESHDLQRVLETMLTRLDTIDEKLESLMLARRKSMEWIAQLSEHISSLDTFREEVRASLEPLFGKIEGFEDNLRILRHATSDVSRRMDTIEQQRRKKATAS